MRNYPATAAEPRRYNCAGSTHPVPGRTGRCHASHPAAPTRHAAGRAEAVVLGSGYPGTACATLLALQRRLTSPARRMGRSDALGFCSLRALDISVRSPLIAAAKPWKGPLLSSTSISAAAEVCPGWLGSPRTATDCLDFSELHGCRATSQRQGNDLFPLNGLAPVWWRGILFSLPCRPCANCRPPIKFGRTAARRLIPDPQTFAGSAAAFTLVSA